MKKILYIIIEEMIDPTANRIKLLRPNVHIFLDKDGADNFMAITDKYCSQTEVYSLHTIEIDVWFKYTKTKSTG